MVVLSRGRESVFLAKRFFPSIDRKAALDALDRVGTQLKHSDPSLLLGRKGSTEISIETW